MNMSLYSADRVFCSLEHQQRYENKLKNRKFLMILCRMHLDVLCS